MSIIIQFGRYMFAKHRFIANSIVYGTLYASAEISQQMIIRKFMNVRSKPLDMESVARYGIIGSFLYAPSLHVWYNWLDKKFVGTQTKTVIKKVLLDQFFFTPQLLAGFFIVMSILEKKPDLFEECYEKFAPTFLTSCVFWLPAQTINFFYISSTYRVAFVATSAFAWINILCYIKRQKYKSSIDSSNSKN